MTAAADTAAFAAALEPLFGRAPPITVVAAGHHLQPRLGAPVAVVPAGYAELEDRAIRVIGVGFDGDREAVEAAVAAGELAAALGATVRVWAFVAPGELQYHEPPPDRSFEGVTAREQVERQLTAVLDALPPAVRPLGQVLPGVPATELAKRTGEVDLLVLGTHARGWIERTLFGSVAREVVRCAQAPVLVFPGGTAAAFGAALLATA